jgi:hypothetical protein
MIKAVSLLDEAERRGIVGARVAQMIREIFAAPARTRLLAR